VSTPTRLANKTQWALQDILTEVAFASARWEKLMSQAEKNMDAVTMAPLANMRHNLATIERKAGQALNGEYVD